MANVRSGNSHYVDSTGSLTTNPVKVIGVLLTATAANGVIVLKDSGGSITRADLRNPTSGTTVHFDLSDSPLYFPTGINVTALTNNPVATIIYDGNGG